MRLEKRMKNRKIKSGGQVKLSSYLKPYWLTAIISPIFMIGEVGADLILTKKMSIIVNEGVLVGNQSVIIKTGLLMLLIAALVGIMGLACAWTASVSSQSFGNDLRVDAFNRVMHLSQQQTD